MLLVLTGRQTYRQNSKCQVKIGFYTVEGKELDFVKLHSYQDKNILSELVYKFMKEVRRDPLIKLCCKFISHRYLVVEFVWT